MVYAADKRRIKLDLEDAKAVIFGADDSSKYSSFISRKDMVGTEGLENIFEDRRREGVDYSSFGITRDIVPSQKRPQV